MSSISLAQPDVTLLLDMDGVIRTATLAGSVAGEGVDGWLGRPWRETVIDLGGDKVRRMLDDAKSGGISAFRQVTQRFPSGLELPMEYTTVMLGGRAGLIAIGKSLHAVADLQSRLIAAQQAMERDHWRMREIETRYRLLFEASTEAVVLLRATNHRIVEANPAAVQMLGLSAKSSHGRDFLQEIAPQERDGFETMLRRVHDQGKAPGIVVHLGKSRVACMVRASRTASEDGQVFLLQLSLVEPAKHAATPAAAAGELDEILQRIPDGFVLLDDKGNIRQANRTFLDLIEAPSLEAVTGESVGRWIWRPGADLAVLMANYHQHRVVRLFSTTIHGEHGRETDVEISLAATSRHDPRQLAMIVRDVGRRLQPPNGGSLFAAVAPLSEQLGKVPLRKVVDEAISVVERQHIKAAIEAAGDNRTVAAEILGLSRQSLYAKIKRYGLEKRSSEEGPNGS